MNSGRVVAISGALLAVVSLVVAWVHYEGIMVVISLFALVYGSIASKRCSAGTCMCIMAASVAALVCTVLSVTVLDQGNFLGDDGNPTIFWFVLIGLVHTVPVVPLTFVTYIIVASMTGASYNWAVVRGLSPFIGMGMEVPGFVLEYVFQGSDNWMTDNGYILYHFLMTAIVMIVFAWYASRYMRARRIIVDGNGVGEVQC